MAYSSDIVSLQVRCQGDLSVDKTHLPPNQALRSRCPVASAPQNAVELCGFTQHLCMPERTDRPDRWLSIRESVVKVDDVFGDLHLIDQ